MLVLHHSSVVHRYVCLLITNEWSLIMVMQATFYDRDL